MNTRSITIDGILYDWSNYRFLDEDVIGFNDVYRFLSNFWNQKISFGKITFPNAEAAYQAAKSADPKDWDQFTRVQTGAEAKALGRKIILQADWNQKKLGVMEQVVHQKFQDHWLRQSLLSTENHQLVEDNYWNDTFWGVCKGVGENHLGKILMAERTALQKKGK